MERLLQWKFAIRSVVAREPWLSPLHQLVIWWTQYKQRPHIDVRECRVGSDTEFVIDGFQGTANSFAARAFKYAQEEPVRLAHHLHSPAQIIKAVEGGIPTLVTIRNPVDAAASLLSRWPYVTPRQALRSYTRFYQKIEPYKSALLISPFPVTTQHLDTAFQTVNHRFGTDFSVFAHHPEDVRAIRDPESLQSEAEAQRKQRKSEAIDALQRPQHGFFREEARRIHRHLQSHSIGDSARSFSTDISVDDRVSAQFRPNLSEAVVPMDSYERRR